MRITLLCFFVFFSILGCSDSTAPDLLVPADHEWTLDLNTRVDTTKYIETFNLGDRLSIVEDTLMITNDFGGWLRKIRLFERAAIPDTTFGFVLEPQPDSTLTISHYYRDSLKKKWHFLLAKESLTEIPEGGLSGKTFRFKFPDSDSLRVYIGYDENMAFGRGVKEYFVSGREHTFIPKTKVSGGGIHLWYNSSFSPSPLRGGQFYFPMGQRITGFNRFRYRFKQELGGQVVVSYLRRVKDRHVLTDMPLDPVRSVIPPKVTIDEFAERISTGKVVVDQSYPRVDSADVKYSYTEDYYSKDGLDPIDLNYLEFSFSPGGEYFVIARDRVIMNGNWELSPDRNYIITLNKDGAKFLHFPILAYTDAFIDLRLPLKVKTREPRGVKLESYCILDAFVRVERE
ncbi:hypothetical protein [Neolewinella persica]|uniref:hypothetical protein n=1 Tax=Neolewinella persica TaxID=70998 RepID=UPI00037560FE|nr:hypothetical protein [Neolewinella persica]